MRKIKPSDLKAEAQRLIKAGKMPMLFDVVETIRKVKHNPEFIVPVIHDALIRNRKRRLS